MKVTEQMKLYVEEPVRPGSDRTSTFLDNLSLPIHRWFRYSAGFSALWARELIEREKASGRKRVFDPFAGCGTTLLEAELCNVSAIGVEAHPFVTRIARAKLCWRESPTLFRDYGLSVLEKAKTCEPNVNLYPPLIQKCFPSQTLRKLDSIYQAWQVLADGSAASELTLLAIISILRECSPVGTAQWQYILPNKRKEKAVDPYKAFRSKVYLMADDMSTRQARPYGPQAALYLEDARACPSVPDCWAQLIITSPPYANNYDYADATRLEMSFLGDVQRWADLQDTVRKHLVRSCTQHVASMNGKTKEILAEPLLDPIRDTLINTCRRLEEQRDKHGGKKPYDTMIAAYFSDMARVWVALRRIATKGSLICFVVGDSAPYGIYVPVDEWLGELAIASGFRSYMFEKTRQRNVKWKNRKHRVPLHEGRLWVEG